MDKLIIKLTRDQAEAIYAALTERIAQSPSTNEDLSDLVEIMLISAGDQGFEFYGDSDFYRG